MFNPSANKLPAWFWALCLTQAGSLLVFLNFAGALPLIQVDWQLTHAEAGTIQAAVQGGYLAAVLVLSSLTDYVAPKWLILLGALGAGLGNLAFATQANGLVSAIVYRSIAGFGVAGIYMPGVKLVSQSIHPALKGRALGLFVASFTAGSAASVALGGNLSAVYGWRPVFAWMSLGPLAGMLAAWYVIRHLPDAEGFENNRAARPEMRRLAAELRQNRNALLVIVTYSAHVWELFGLRSWLPAFFTAVLVHTGVSLTTATQRGASAAGLATLAGAVSIVLGAALSDRYGRTPIIILLAAAGLLSSAMLGFTLTWPWLLVAAAGILTAFLVSADSAVISATLTEAIPPGYLGRVLAIYSFSGFFAGSVSPLVFGAILDVTDSAWRWAFLSLAAGGLAALTAAAALHRRLRPSQLHPVGD